jgi:hypothetical protein
MKLSGGVVKEATNADYPFALAGGGSYDLTNNRYSTLAEAENASTTRPQLITDGGKHLEANDTIGRTFEQMCTAHPLMIDGKPHGIAYA